MYGSSTYNLLSLFQFTINNDKAQKYLLGAVEKLVGVEFNEQLMEKTPIVLKCLYDLDLIEEETFLEWGKKVSPYILYLQ